ncbi:TPA: hypothetical protein ACJK7E_000523 [Acinetobacter baumannii]|uniref:hypothetical protein n=1 Tax=Acinetobacter baumannii TaxID=470 RepID=UPI0022B54D0E|nr:hypothetical protein [Acinetobacter baumannii]HDI2987011.1 hypothetical protein [Acinetobacter baumannii]
MRYAASLILITLFLSQTVMAKSQNEATCKTLEKLAEAVMIARQEGAPMSEIYMKDYGSADRNKVMKSLIKEAYKTPRFNSQQSKKNAVDDFKNEKFSYCIENLK